MYSLLNDFFLLDVSLLNDTCICIYIFYSWKFNTLTINIVHIFDIQFSSFYRVCSIAITSLYYMSYLTIRIFGIIAQKLYSLLQQHEFLIADALFIYY